MSPEPPRAGRRGPAPAERREITVNRVPGDVHKRLPVGAGLPEAFAGILVDVDAAVSRGLLARRNGDPASLIGRPTTPIADSIAEGIKGIDA